MTRQSKCKKIAFQTQLYKQKVDTYVASGETTGRRLCKPCGCMLSVEFTQVTYVHVPATSSSLGIGNEFCVAKDSAR